MMMKPICLTCLDSLTLVLRNFAKNLEGWLESAMINVAKEMVEAKVDVKLNLFYNGRSSISHSCNEKLVLNLIQRCCCVVKH